MRSIGSIRTFEDRAFLSWIARMSLVVIVAGVVLGVVWFSLTDLTAPGALDEEVSGFVGFISFGSLSRWGVQVILGFFATLIVHEAVHAIFFRAFAPRGSRVTFGANWKAGMLYACAEGIVYTRRQYALIALAPTVVVTAAVAAIGLAWAHPLWAFVVGTLHLSGCTGDWGYLRALREDPHITHCEDTSWGVVFYAEDEGAGDKVERDGVAQDEDAEAAFTETTPKSREEMGESGEAACGQAEDGGGACAVLLSEGDARHAEACTEENGTESTARDDRP